MELARLDDVDWQRWKPAERATLCFVVTSGRILLIRKKRGLGAGKINGPGGKLARGESPEACAVREVEEELGVTPTGLSHRGELRFQFTDGLAILCHVFHATGFRGEPVETPEAAPLWTPLDRIPFDEMWADDRLWLPRMLAGERFSGWGLFRGDEMLDWQLEVETSRQAPSPDLPLPSDASTDR